MTSYPPSGDRVSMSYQVYGAVCALLHAASSASSESPPFEALAHGDALVQELRGAAPSFGPDELDDRATHVFSLLHPTKRLPQEAGVALTVSRELLRYIAHILRTTTPEQPVWKVRGDAPRAARNAFVGLTSMHWLASVGAPVEEGEQLVLAAVKADSSSERPLPADIAAIFRTRPADVPLEVWRRSRSFDLRQARQTTARVAPAPVGSGTPSTLTVLGHADIPDVVRLQSLSRRGPARGGAATAR